MRSLSLISSLGKKHPRSLGTSIESSAAHGPPHTSISSHRLALLCWTLLLLTYVHLPTVLANQAAPRGCFSVSPQVAGGLSSQPVSTVRECVNRCAVGQLALIGGSSGENRFGCSCTGQDAASGFRSVSAGLCSFRCPDGECGGVGTDGGLVVSVYGVLADTSVSPRPSPRPSLSRTVSATVTGGTTTTNGTVTSPASVSPTPTGNTTASFNATTTTSTPTPTPTTDITTSTTSTTTTTTTFTWPGHRNFNSGEDVFDPPPDVLVGGHPVPTADPGTGTSTPSLIQGSASITLSAGLWVSLVFGILLVCGIGVAVFRIIHERHSEATLKRNNSTALKSLQRAESVRRLSDPDLDDGAPTLMRTSSTKTVPPDLDIMSIGVAVTPITDFGSVTTGPRTGDFVTLDSVAVGGFGSTLNDIFGDANAVGGGATAGGVASTTYSGSESNSSKRGLPSVGGTTPTLMNSSSSSRDGDSTMWADETFMTLDNAIVVPPTGEGETAQSPIHPSSANPSPVTAAASPALHTEGHPSRPPPIFTHVSAMVSQASLYSSTSSAGPFNSGSSMWIDDASSEQKGPSPSVGSSAISVQDPFGDAESLDGHDRDDPFVDGKP